MTDAEIAELALIEGLKQCTELRKIVGTESRMHQYWKRMYYDAVVELDAWKNPLHPTRVVERLGLDKGGK